MIYQDVFKVGDVVTWRDVGKAMLTDGRKRFGDRLTIRNVQPVTYGNLRSAGHTQPVTIVEDPDAGFGPKDSCFSGAFFRHLAEWER